MENLGFGFNVTLIGMGLVFALLALLWLVLYLIGNLDSLPFMKGGEEEEAPEEEQEETEEDLIAVQHEGDADPDMLAAITIAVAAHMAVKRRQAAPSMRKTAPGSQIFASRWVAAGRTRQTDSWTHKG